MRKFKLALSLGLGAIAAGALFFASGPAPASADCTDVLVCPPPGTNLGLLNAAEQQGTFVAEDKGNTKAQQTHDFNFVKLVDKASP